MQTALLVATTRGKLEEREIGVRCAWPSHTRGQHPSSTHIRKRTSHPSSPLHVGWMHVQSGWGGGIASDGGPICALFGSPTTTHQCIHPDIVLMCESANDVAAAGNTKPIRGVHPYRGECIPNYPRYMYGEPYLCNLCVCRE